MTESRLETILKQINNRINDLHHSGEFFNLFSSINIETNEKYHSRLIAELLNPKGSHGQGRIFLDIFIKILNTEKNFKNNIIHDEHILFDVKTEEYMGQIDKKYRKGGRIDISLNSPSLKIFIENKIYANDQPNQLFRYWNYNNNALILYLTLFGDDATSISTNNEIKNNEHYHCISYSTDIKNWLNESINYVNNKPKIKELLIQYNNTIDTLTSGGQMSKEMIKILLADSDSVEATFRILEQRENLINEMKQLFIKQLYDISNTFGLTAIYNKENVFNDDTYPFLMTKKEWGSLSIGIVSYTEKDIWTDMGYCIYNSAKIKKDEAYKMRIFFNETIGENTDTDEGEVMYLWPYYKYFTNSYRFWHLSSPVWKEISNGGFSKIIIEKLQILKIAVEDYINR